MKVVVNGQEITDEQYRQEIEQIRGRMPRATEAQMQDAAVRRIVDRVVLRQEANRRVSDVSSKEVQEELERMVARSGGEEQFFRRLGMSRKDEPELRNSIRQGLKIDRLLDHVGRDAPAPSEEHIRAHFDKNKDDFVKPEEVHVLHVMKPATPATAHAALREMIAVRRRLLAGADFAAVADEISERQDSTHGDLGFVPRGRMPDEFDAVVFSMNAGELSPVFKSAYGYHLAKVLENRPSRPMTFEEAHDEIRGILLQQARGALVEQWLDEARGRAAVEITE